MYFTSNYECIPSKFIIKHRNPLDHRNNYFIQCQSIQKLDWGKMLIYTLALWSVYLYNWWLVVYVWLRSLIDKITFHIDIFGWNMNELKSTASGKVLLSLCHNMVIITIKVVFKRIFLVRESLIAVKDTFICESLKLSHLYVQFLESFNLQIMSY